jgi:hypothetical protein
MHFMALCGQISAILAGNTGNERGVCHVTPR